jgi:hypothetical protein
MKQKRGSGTLLEEMKRYLPIPARPTNELARFLRQKGMRIDMNRDLNIIEVFDSGDMGGILCAIEGNKGQKEALVVSLTHLIIKPYHPLSDKIIAYQTHRIQSLMAANRERQAA